MIRTTMGDASADDPQRNLSPSAKGVDFERRIAALYRLLGFQVTHNTHLSSSQTDLLCWKAVPGAPGVHVYVECKYRGGGSVTKQDVVTFVSTYDVLRSHHALTCAVMVSNHPFTAEAKAISEHRGDVKLLTEQELNDELLNVTSSLSRFADHYETQEIFSSYIPLHTRSRGKNEASARLDLAKWFTGWISQPSRLAVLLGDFGAGKTTFLRHLKYTICKEYLDGFPTRIPFYLQLRDFGRFPDVQAFVTSQLLLDFGVSDHATFRYMLQGACLLLLLDGFDEMGRQVDSQTRKHFFAQVTPLFCAGSKSILTCRPSYFVTESEMKEVFQQLDHFVLSSVSLLRSGQSRTSIERREGLEPFSRASAEWIPEGGGLPQFSSDDVGVHTIELFDGQDIDKYLKRCDDRIRERSGQNWETVKQRIWGTYDLQDLARRPILLNLLVTTLPHIPDSTEPSPAIIYSTYTESWLRHEYSKGEV
jgi:hypothetical protein